MSVFGGVGGKKTSSANYLHVGQSGGASATYLFLYLIAH